MRAIELKNVSFSYDGTAQILKNVNFSVEYGEVALLSGLSGEGKSTLLSLIAGIIPNVITGKVEGEVVVDGESIKGKKMSEICRKVGVVLQNADSQIIQKIVEDEIAFGCENFAFAPEKIERQIGIVSNMMGIDRKWKTRTLSGGQKQRLITASTLATGQKILILDEPLANLDLSGADFLMNTLRKLAKAGYAVLVVEHRLDMVLFFVDSVWNIRAGVVTKVEDKQEYLTSQTVVIADEAERHEAKDPLFELKNISYFADGKEILKDISFSVKRGERLLILGENGCGKTTLLRIFARLNKPSGGRIEQFLDPKLRKSASKKCFQRVGVVYQNPNYMLFMPTVEKEILFGAKSEVCAREMIKLFGLEKIKSRHPQSLSEGQKRRVSIAAVAAAMPDVLLLDEPTVGQDYSGLKSLVEILNELHDRTHNVMITVTHDMRCAEALCDRAVWIENGIVKAEGGKNLAHTYFFERR